MSADVVGNYYRMFRFTPELFSLECGACLREVLGEEMLVAIFATAKNVQVSVPGVETTSLKMCRNCAPNPARALDVLDRLFYNKEGQ